MSEAQVRRSSRIQARLIQQEKRKAEEERKTLEEKISESNSKAENSSKPSKQQKISKNRETSKKFKKSVTKKSVTKVIEDAENVEVENGPKDPGNWGLDSDSDHDFEQKNQDIENPNPENHDSDGDAVVSLPNVLKRKPKKTGLENNKVGESSKNKKSATKKSRNQTKNVPELTEAEKSELAIIREHVLNIVGPIADKHGLQHTLESQNKSKFELPKLTKWALSNVKGYSTYEPHKNPWFERNGYGMGYDPFVNMGWNGSMPDQPHPAIVQAAKANDLENVRRLVKHALSLPESKDVKTQKAPVLKKIKDPEKLKEARKIREINKMLKKQKEENIVSFKKFTSREQALNIARYVTEEEDKGFYSKEWEWYEDTALHAAIKNGNDVIVKVLLEAGADPTLMACVGDSDDKYSCLELIQKKGKGSNTAMNIEMMLNVALQFWDKASYSGIGAGSSGSSRNWTNANQCKDFERMLKEFKVLEGLCSWS